MLQLRCRQRVRSLNNYLSPAKLNLFFRVLRKRPDGYHDIASLFQAIDLFDRLFFSLSDQDALTCSNPTIPCDATNLVAKALAQLRARTHVPPVKIHIEKQIPIEAGLGGGSSNAATALWGLNKLIGSPLTQYQLIEIGACIGSDVPFFFSSGTAYCTGRGEILEPFSLPESLIGYIAKPAYGLSTPLVYKHTIVEELSQRNPEEVLKSYPQFFNDLEISSFRLEPRLGSLRNELRKSFEEVVMTGSGTAFFCLKGEPKPIEGVTFVPFQSTHRMDSGDWY
jgi:4-diphosphocytidyl-2-C-methyl-D-erythritol kinase